MKFTLETSDPQQVLSIISWLPKDQAVLGAQPLRTQQTGRLTGVGKDVATATACAEKQLPNLAKITQKSIEHTPRTYPYLVSAANETEARERAIAESHSKGQVLTVEIIRPARKGVLGIFSRLARYKVLFVEPAEVEVAYEITGMSIVETGPCPKTGFCVVCGKPNAPPSLNTLNSSTVVTFICEPNFYPEYLLSKYTLANQDDRNATCHDRLRATCDMYEIQAYGGERAFLEASESPIMNDPTMFRDVTRESVTRAQAKIERARKLGLPARHCWRCGTPYPTRSSQALLSEGLCRKCCAFVGLAYYSLHCGKGEASPPARYRARKAELLAEEKLQSLLAHRSPTVAADEAKNAFDAAIAHDCTWALPHLGYAKLLHSLNEIEPAQAHLELANRLAAKGSDHLQDARVLQECRELQEKWRVQQQGTQSEGRET
jgi:hypothetical protein